MAFLAGHMVNYSIIFLSLEWFQSHSIAGIGFGLSFGPPIIFGWFAGVFCDRYSPRKVILIAQNSYFLSLILLYFAFNSEPSLQLILLLTAAFLTGVGWSFVAPARFAALPFYADKNKLTTASIALNLMVMTGFGLAPLLLKNIQASFGWYMVLSVTALLVLISSLILLSLKMTSSHKTQSNALTEIKESLKYVRQSSHLTQLLSLAGITYLLMGPMQVLLPSVAKETLGLSDAAQGNYLSLVAFSLIAGGILVLILKSKLHFGKTIMATILFAGFGIGILGLINNLSFSMMMLIIASVSAGMAVSLIVAGLQHYAPEHLRGRIMSIYTIISQFIPAFSGVIAGVLASKLNFANALLAFAIIISISILFAFLTFNKIRTLNTLEVKHD